MSRHPAIGEQSTPPAGVESDARDAGEIGERRDGPEVQPGDVDAQYRNIFEAAGEGMVIANLDGVIVEANPAACQMYGYTHDELVGLPAGDLVHPADLHLIAESTEAAHAGGSYLRQGVALHKDGTLFHAEGRVTAFSFKGEPHVLVVVRDVTDRVQAEEQLREKEEQYRSVFEAATDGLVIQDSEGKIVEINPAYCRLLGYTRDELVGQPISILVPPEYHHLIAESMQAIAAGDTPSARVDVLRKDGTLLQVEGHGVAFLLNGKRHYLGVSRDVTERVRAEEQLKEREAQYRSIFEATTDGFAILDTQGRFVEVNPAYCKLTGYSRDELIGMDTSALIHPDYHHLIAEGMQSIREGTDVWTRSILVRKDGTFLHIEGGGTQFTYKGEPHFLGMARDITERLQAEEQRRAQEEEYRAIFESTIDGLVILDLDGTIVEANAASCEMFGYTREELIGLNAAVLTPPERLPALAESLQRAVEEGRIPHNAADKAIRKDGRVLDVETRGRGFTYKGRPHLLAVVRDVTERVKAEEQLREKEEQYRSIFEATTDGLGVVDMEGNIVEVNPAYCQMHGYTRDELIGVHVTALIHPDYHHLFDEGMQLIETGKPFQERFLRVRKDGTSFHIDGRAITFLFNGKPHTLGVSRDISEQVEAEVRLREREEQYRSIFESSADGLGIYDQKGFLVEANPAYCQMLGYTHDELIGLHAGAIVHPDYRHIIAEGLERVNRDVPFRTEIVLLRKDGTSFPVEGGATTFMYRGTPHELVVLRDISERVEAEKQIREREAEYRGIFEATNDGLIIADMDGYIVEANPAYCRMFGYTREEVIGLHSTALTAPESRHVVAESVKTLTSADAYQTVAMGLRKDGSTFFAEARATRFMYRGKAHYLSVVQDVTERVQAYELLEERVEERTRELSTLLDVSHNVSSTLELQPLLDLILDQIAGVVDYAGASISLIDGNELEIVAFRGRGSSDIAVGLRIPVDRMDPGPESWGSSPLIIDDVRADTPDAVAYRGNESKLLDSSFSYVRSWMAVPLIVNERLVGVLTLNGDEPNLYTPHHAELVLGIASQAAFAIENARLYERSEQRTRELATLLDISHNVASTLELQPLLGLILDQLKAVVNFDGATVMAVEGEDLVNLHRQGPGRSGHVVQRHFPMASHELLWSELQRGEPVIIDDVRGDSPLAEDYRRINGELIDTTLRYVRSWMGVPMILKERVIGVLSLASTEPNAYSPRDASLVRAVANQAAVAIENARLYRQAQEVAALEERQRLARELHDSVSQALFGIGLGARTARALLERDIDQAAQSIDYVLSLTQGGMAEMRALIFELRPESLESEGLAAALQKQAAALTARHEIPIATTLCDEPSAPLPVKEALYRIAQEALHNTFKHARPTRVELTLDASDGETVLEVRDDGEGFDTQGSFPGHLGLHSMRERAQRVGGTLEVESRVGKGTRVRVRVPTRSDG